MLYFDNFSCFSQNSYSLSVLFFNIIIYLLSTCLIFYIFFLFNLDNFVNLNNIKSFSSTSFFYLILILSLLSLVGMPPISGFVGKFLMAIFLSLKSNFFYFIIFILLNLFMIYFYIQNFRFLIKKTNLNSLNILLNNVRISIYNYFFIVSISFFLFFGIFFADSFLLILSSLLFF